MDEYHRSRWYLGLRYDEKVNSDGVGINVSILLRRIADGDDLGHTIESYIEKPEEEIKDEKKYYLLFRTQPADFSFKSLPQCSLVPPPEVRHCHHETYCCVASSTPVDAHLTLKQCVGSNIYLHHVSSVV